MKNYTFNHVYSLIFQQYLQGSDKILFSSNKWKQYISTEFVAYGFDTYFLINKCCCIFIFIYVFGSYLEVLLCSGVIPRFALWNYSWEALGDDMGYLGWNLGWLPVRQVPYSLYNLSIPDTTFSIINYWVWPH